MGIGIWQLVVILLIVLVLFGAKRLRNVGSDLGAAVKGFRSSMKEEDEKKIEQPESKVIEGEVTKSQEKDKA
ncbi:MAG: twin-arginine translocase TatA/TatE family subunit [Gammaproteobacteria bacterium]|nr:twin-arginine translocase TatA/TatE family subunit [Gammaproteobacteria bacterium]MDH5650248.1 twin-arginine translocase TatA/TatE family subunit [Gammaproteobacteria bacterium]